MGLAIDRVAAPTMGLDAFAPLAERRGFDGVELRASDLDAKALPEGSTRITGVYVTSVAEVTSTDLMACAAAFGVPVVAAIGPVTDEELARWNTAYAKANVTLCIAHGTNVEEAADLTAAIERTGASHIRLAWELRPNREKLDDAAAILLVTGERLGYVRLHGGGPELAEQEGTGIGAVIAKVALSGYSGPVVVTPSTPDRASAWQEWLARSAKSGCGSAKAKGDIELDMRPVEPRDRLETIMGAYRSLSVGRTLHITLDHDPQCMYFTLDATEPPNSFEFERLEEGPLVWRVDIRKRPSHACGCG